MPGMPRLARVLAAVCCGTVMLTAASSPAPVIYCTDLFHPHEDPDDHFDLAALFALDAVDVKGVVLDQGAKQKQRPGAIPVSQLNQLTGRKIPVVLGLSEKLRSPGDAARQQPGEFQGGVEFILRTIRESAEPVQIACVGSVRDLVAAWNRAPDLMRSKVGRILAFIGEASHPSFREYNVDLDPHAYVGLMRSGLPVWWVPCFDGGLWENRGHASFWKASHRDLLDQAAPAVVQFFIYALEKETSDPMAFLLAPVDPVRRERLFGGERNLWCTTIFQTLTWPPSRTDAENYQFRPIRIQVGDDGRVREDPNAGPYTVMQFEIRDRQRYAAAMTRDTARLLARLGR